MEQRLAEIKVRSFIDISHELRTPLTLISGPVSEVLSQEPLTSRTRHHLQLVQKKVSIVCYCSLIKYWISERYRIKKLGLTIEYRDIIIMLHNIMDNFPVVGNRKKL